MRAVYEVNGFLVQVIKAGFYLNLSEILRGLKKG